MNLDPISIGTACVRSPAKPAWIRRRPAEGVCVALVGREPPRIPPETARHDRRPDRLAGAILGGFETCLWAVLADRLVALGEIGPRTLMLVSEDAWLSPGRDRCPGRHCSLSRDGDRDRSSEHWLRRVAPPESQRPDYTTGRMSRVKAFPGVVGGYRSGIHEYDRPDDPHRPKGRLDGLAVIGQVYGDPKALLDNPDQRDDPVAVWMNWSGAVPTDRIKSREPVT